MTILLNTGIIDHWTNHVLNGFSAVLAKVVYGFFLRHARFYTVETELAYQLQDQHILFRCAAEELLTALHGTLGNLELVASQSSDPKARKLLSRSLRNTSLLQHLIDDFLELERRRRSCRPSSHVDVYSSAVATT